MRSIKERYGERMTALLAAFHREPEVAFHEKETTRRIRYELLELGLEIIDLGTETGVVARLRTGKPGRVVGLRADIDGLEQDEAVDRADRSVHAGVMHACGHDTHITSLLGAAMALAAEKERLTGDVIFVFQPAEETIAGANALIGHGLFEKAPMDVLFGLHNTPDYPVGTVCVKNGAVMAAKDDFRITVRGRSGHGGHPQRCVDPVVAACGVVSALQTVVSRNVHPSETAVLSVCSIHGGTVSNIIPDEVTLLGCMRSFSKDVQQLMLNRLTEVATGVAAGYGCRASIEHYASVPPLVNSDTLYPLAQEAAVLTAGAESVCEPEANIASEDFAVYAQLLPSFYYFLGSGVPGEENPPWHSAQFRADADTVFWGAALLKNSVLIAQKHDLYGGKK